MNLQVKTFFDQATSTLTYIVFDENSKDAVIIDPVLDFDQAAGCVSSQSVEQVLHFVNEKNLRLHFVLETHAHADHLSGSEQLKKRVPGLKVVIGAGITKVQREFKKVFNLGDDFTCDGSQFDVLLMDQQVLNAGTIAIKALSTPGHTPACLTYVIQELVFTGDVIFIPDSGTGRCDFPEGSAQVLFESIMQKIYQLPDHFKIYVGHDYQPHGRELQFHTTVGEQKKSNIHIKANTTREQYVKFRQERDKTLSFPKLLFPSVQINIDAGRLPAPEKNGSTYLKTPITFL